MFGVISKKVKFIKLCYQLLEKYFLVKLYKNKPIYYISHHNHQNHVNIHKLPNIPKTQTVSTNTPRLFSKLLPYGLKQVDISVPLYMVTS
jgi:hypothetical protein